MIDDIRTMRVRMMRRCKHWPPEASAATAEAAAALKVAKIQIDMKQSVDSPARDNSSGLYNSIGLRLPGQTRPLYYKHAPTASPHPLRTASTPSRPARELERPATAVPVPSRGSHPGTRRSPRAPRAPRAAQTLQTTQLRVFPVLFSKVRPIPHPRSPQRVRARCCVRPRRLGAARSLFGVGSSLQCTGAAAPTGHA